MGATRDKPIGENDYSDDVRKVLIIGSDGSGSDVPVKSTRLPENILGVAGTGTNPNKVFTLATSQAVDITEVFHQGSLLVETRDWVKDNSAKTVTMNDFTVEKLHRKELFSYSSVLSVEIIPKIF